MIIAKAKTIYGKSYSFDEEFLHKSVDSTELDYLIITARTLLEFPRSRGFSKISKLKVENGKGYRHSVIHKFALLELLTAPKHLAITGLGLGFLVIPEGV